MGNDRRRVASTRTGIDAPTSVADAVPPPTYRVPAGGHAAVSLDLMLRGVEEHRGRRRVNERVVLMALAEHADPAGRGVYPTKNTVAAQASVDPKTVQRIPGPATGRGGEEPEQVWP